MADKLTIPGYDDKLDPDIAWWSATIAQGIEYRDKWAMSSKWGTWDKYYRNDYPNPGSRLGLADIMPVNLFYMMARSFVPRVYFRNPSLSIQAGKPGPEHLGLAMLMERIDNRLIIDMKIKRTMRKIINSTFFHGTGFGKLGFGAQFHPIGYTDTFAMESESKEGFQAEYRSDIQADMPWFGHVQTDHVVVPAGTADYLDAPWTAHIIYRPTEDMKLDPRMKNTESLGSTHESKDKTGTDLTMAYEVHDKRTGLAFTFAPSAEGHEENGTMLVPPGRDLQQSRNGGPMYPTVFNDNLDTFWGLPDGAILEPLQDEINEVATQIMYHRRLSLIKFVAEKGAIDEDWAKKFLTEMDVSAVLFGEKGAITPIQSGTIPPELFVSFDKTMDIVRMTMGFSRNQFGEFMGGSEKPSAKEAGIVQQASEIRIDERRDIVADYLLDVMQDTNRLIFEHWSEERVERVIGPYGIPIWVKFTGEMLAKGQYELNVDPDSSLPESKAQREAKALSLFQLLYPLTQEPDAQTGRPMLSSTKLTRLTLHEMQGTKYDDLLAGVPNIYDPAFVSLITQNDRLLTEPQSPGELGAAVQSAGSQAGQQQTEALRNVQGSQANLSPGGSGGTA